MLKKSLYQKQKSLRLTILVVIVTLMVLIALNESRIKIKKGKQGGSDKPNRDIVQHAMHTDICRVHGSQVF